MNLQDCDKVINYDLHWSPVRLIQRLGRIDRIGSEYEYILAFNFLPETGIERQLSLKEKLAQRIAEIQETIGEDAAILDPSEQVNEEAMYAIYERKGERLGQFEEEEEEHIDLNEAEELFRLMRRDNPDEFDRIANLRGGLRAGCAASNKGFFAFFSAGRYQQLLLADKEGNVVSRDLSDALKTITCGPEEPALPLPENYNAALMKTKRLFDNEVRHHRTQRAYVTSATHAQRYILRELRALFNATRDDEERAVISLLEEAFRGAMTTAVKRELNPLRRNGMTGKELVTELKRIYFQHNLRDMPTRIRSSAEDVSRIVCSEALV